MESATLKDRTPLTYDVVMATRNRPEAVELSLPLILSQTRLPRRVVVVDSSDEGAAIADIVSRLSDTTTLPLQYHASEAGLTRQRNVGLRLCDADVVLFPDDDSLLYEDAAAEILAIYEADTAGHVAGVAAAAVNRPPEAVAADLGRLDAETVGPLKATLRRVRQAAKEAAGILNPFLATGRKLSRRWPRPDWLADHDAVVVPYMTGFRMSFRRNVIAETGFDEALRRYGWYEDIDASFSVLRQGLIVTARQARVYHHRAAAKRADGWRMGLWAILNRGYVVTKHVRANPESMPRPRLEALRLRFYCMVRVAAYAAMARDSFGRERVRGAWAGFRRLGRLIGASGEELPQVYRDLEGDERASGAVSRTTA